ncbi:siderophore-interacting protein [Brevundimonas faecalis]|uniref:siderophore-interacting protein n=1 Tax=Brevundimonas faecalis TaxID=947378 RepID=UPI0036136CA1
MGPYRLFDLVLARRTRLCPSLTRFTFGGAGVEHVGAFAPDQRVKLFFPSADGRAAQLAERLGAANAGWLEAYRDLPEERRPPMRTYTIRALRPEAGEVDIDFVMHGGPEHGDEAADLGPAGRWAMRARVGDRLSMSAPDSRSAAEPVGFEWRPPRAARQVLIAADETAVPAAMGIVEAMGAWTERPRVRLLVEAPSEADRLPTPDWIEAEWLPRRGGYGEALTAAVRGLDLSGVLPTQGERRTETDEAIGRVDIDAEILWDTAVDEGAEFYAWIACETRAARDIRLHLTRERGAPRRSVACMGYWREGRVLE